MKYSEFLKRKSFSHQELIGLSNGQLVDDAPHRLAKLPAPPFLMFNRVTELSRGRRGRIVAEQDISLDAWYFQCHFIGDPVQPGCLGVDAIWQLIGLYITASGSRGTGRALGAKEIEFSGQIRPHNSLVRYEVDIRRYSSLGESGLGIAIGDGAVFVDDELIYQVKGAKVGTFLGIRYENYPFVGENSVGGLTTRS